MAKKKGKAKSNVIPKSAEEKAASTALTAARQVSVEQTRARQSATSKGSFRQRQLRAGGIEMQRYDLQRFTNDPFLVVTPPGGYSRSGAAPRRGPTAASSPRPAPVGRRVKPSGKREVTSDLTPGKPTKRPPSTNDGQLANRERHAEEMARKKAEEAARAAARKKSTQKNKDLGTYRSPSRTGSTAL